MTDTVPDFQTFFRPLLEVLSDGKTHHVRDLYGALADYFQLSEQARQEQIPSGKQLLYQNRIGWSKTYLKKAGLIDQPRRGYVEITKRGRKVLSDVSGQLNVRYLKEYSEEFADFYSVESSGNVETDNKMSSSPETVAEEQDTPEIRLASAYKSIRKAVAAELLEKIKSNTFQFFEQLVVDLLIAMGYGGAKAENGMVTQAYGDGGIDGVINQDKLGLDGIYVQAKRYTDKAVGRPELQSFLGALAPHGVKKGIFITTSTFSRTAQDFLDRTDYRIVLIDGEQLTQLMIDYNVGVSIRDTYHVKRVDTDYFEGDVV
ncbi:restriction system protein [Lewinella marina]|uniref:Restriction endonuclease n=1 Tax=Neolewinella marina TaxID=438751 RepID=A0A2G0CAN0_9BACT|nr:restriction endonuclease [Neolewinella marina]NJB87839.1 restriction system protein [Neolewinella marina]PHK97049.1 restriction endonuclease [Neolewinella marina]